MRLTTLCCWCWVGLLGSVFAADPAIRAEYDRRVAEVTSIPGLAAFWDFVEREDGAAGSGRFVARTAATGERRYPLEPWNISRAFWNQGEEATLADFPLLGRGPFGQAVRFNRPRRVDDLPVLMVPRAVLHDTPLDAKGPGGSVSMVVWLIHQGGNHAIGGIWHEGTDTSPRGEPAAVRVRGQRQYGLFGGLAALPGAASAHVSENGVASFGDRYARHLAVTNAPMRLADDAADGRDAAQWSTVGFTFDAATGIVTAFLDGKADPRWVEQPARDRFFTFAANAWKQARLARFPGLQEGEDPAFPADQRYAPPEETPLEEVVESDADGRRVVVRTYAFTRVRVRLTRLADGSLREEPDAELVALKVNPYWFGRTLYSPPTADEGGPFTIGRVIHSNRHSTMLAWIGGVAVYARALAGEEMARLAALTRPTAGPAILEADAVIERR